MGARERGVAEQETGKWAGAPTRALGAIPRNVRFLLQNLSSSQRF